MRTHSDTVCVKYELQWSFALFIFYGIHFLASWGPIQSEFQCSVADTMGCIFPLDIQCQKNFWRQWEFCACLLGESLFCCGFPILLCTFQQYTGQPLSVFQSAALPPRFHRLWLACYSVWNLEKGRKQLHVHNRSTVFL